MIMSKEKFIIACTGCPTGIAHTFMAKKSLEKEANILGVKIKVETHGQAGIKNKITDIDIENAIGVIIAADKNVDPKRFVGKPVIETGVQDGIHKSKELIEKILSGDAPIMKGELKRASTNASSSKVTQSKKIKE
jgi:PTS system fructose-specific IIC component